MALSPVASPQSRLDQSRLEPVEMAAPVTVATQGAALRADAPAAVTAPILPDPLTTAPDPAVEASPIDAPAVVIDLSTAATERLSIAAPDPDATSDPAPATTPAPLLTTPLETLAEIVVAASAAEVPPEATTPAPEQPVDLSERPVDVIQAVVIVVTPDVGATVAEPPDALVDDEVALQTPASPVEDDAADPTLAELIAGQIAAERAEARRDLSDRQLTDQRTDLALAERVDSSLRAADFLEEQLQTQRAERDRQEADQISAYRAAIDLAQAETEADRLTADRLADDRIEAERLSEDRLAEGRLTEERLSDDRRAADLVAAEAAADRLASEQVASAAEARRIAADRIDAQRAEDLQERLATARAPDPATTGAPGAVAAPAAATPSTDGVQALWPADQVQSAYTQSSVLATANPVARFAGMI